jgi:hypothetical protein
MVTIKNLPERRLVSPANMSIGDIGIIRTWSVPSYIGRVVMKTDNRTLINLEPKTQRDSGGWDTVDQLRTDQTLVELFPRGTIVEITV